MTRRVDRRLMALVAAFAMGGTVLMAGQVRPTQSPDAPPAFRASIEAVQLTVIVTGEDGTPVAGLTADDFEIFENRSPRPIAVFEAVDIPIERRAIDHAAPDVLTNDRPPGRLYVIALDSMSPSSALRARAFLRQFIERHFGPNDTAAVVLTTQGPRDSGQDFTSNPRLLVEAINKFGGGGVEFGGQLREKNFIGDFRNLMQFMSTLPGGRKAVIFVSEGVPVDAWQVVTARPARFGGLFSEIDTGFIEALSLATRNNIALYPIDPRGLGIGVTGEDADVAAEFEQTRRSDTQATLDDRLDMGGLAAVTGGFALVGSNNFTAAFERLVRENSTHYLLGFNSAVEQRDGRYVNIEVRVRRPGLQVRSIGGYVAPRGRPRLPRRPPSSAVLAATWDAVASAVTTPGVPIRVHAAPFKSKVRKKEATVAISLEIAASQLNLVEEDGAYRGILEIVFATTGTTNKRWPIWRHRAALALKPETYERVRDGAVRVLSELPLPKGRYQLRASAGGAARAGSVIYDLDVPDFGDDFSLSGLALTSNQARETFTFSPHTQTDVSMPGPPTTAREFSREDTLTVFAEAYENRKKPHTVTFTIELHDEAGQVLGTFVTERTAVEKPRAPSIHAFAPTLPLEDIPAGRYTIRVTARSSLDRRKLVSRDVPFSVR